MMQKGDAIQRYCPCGKPVAGKRDLCSECAEIYGNDRDDWPEWLREMVRMIKREFCSNELYDSKTIETIDDDDGDMDVLPNERQSLIEQFDDAGSVILRGCREDTFAVEVE